MTSTTIHRWDDQYCSCGQDSVTCQRCGKPVCGDCSFRKNEKNYCIPCATIKFQVGHMGTPRKEVAR